MCFVFRMWHDVLRVWVMNSARAPLLLFCDGHRGSDGAADAGGRDEDVYDRPESRSKMLEKREAEDQEPVKVPVTAM